MMRIPGVLCVIFAVLLLSPLESTAQHAKIDSLEQLLTGKEDTVRVKVLNELTKLYRKVDKEKALALALESNEIARRIDYTQGIYDSYRYQYLIHRTNDNLIGSLEAAKNAMAAAEVLRVPQAIIESKAMISRVYLHIHEFPKALIALNEALALCEKNNDRENLAEVLNDLGNLYSEGIKDLVKAEVYYLRAKEIHLELKQEHGVAVAFINLGELKAEQQLHEQALQYFNQALLIEERLKKDSFISYILGQMGKTYLNSGDYEKAEKVYRIALKYSQDLKLADNEASWWTGLGKVANARKRYPDAVEYFKNAIKALPNMGYGKLVQIHDGLASAYEHLGNHKLALENRNLLLVYKDSLASIGQRDKLLELQARYETKAYEQKIAQLENEQDSAKIKIWLLAGLIVSASIIVSLVFLSLRLRYKTQQALMEKERLKFESDATARLLIEQQLRADIDFKARELTSFTLNLIQKNEIMEELKEQVLDLKKLLPEEERTKILRIVNTINTSQRVDKEWDNFKLYFDQVHQGFFDNLKASYPDLNQNDLKLCALLKLNLETKKIATIMDISPESAKVARYRLRKKLGLQVDESLGNFLNDISGDPARTQVMSES